MRIEHALGMAGGAGGVAEPGGGALVEFLPGEIAVDLGDPVLVGDRVLELGRRHVGGVGENDIALDRRQFVGDRLQERHEGEIDQRHPVFGVVHDPGDLLGEKARIDGVINRASAGDAVPAFEMPVAVPRQRRDPVADLDSVAVKPLGDFQRAFTDGAIVGGVHRPFDSPRDDLLVRELDRGEIDHLVHEEGPFLHPSQHAIPPASLYRRLIAARGLFMGCTLAQHAPLCNRRKWNSSPSHQGPAQAHAPSSRKGARCPTGRTPTAPSGSGSG